MLFFWTRHNVVPQQGLARCLWPATYKQSSRPRMNLKHCKAILFVGMDTHIGDCRRMFAFAGPGILKALLVWLAILSRKYFLIYLWVTTPEVTSELLNHFLRHHQTYLSSSGSVGRSSKPVCHPLTLIKNKRYFEHFASGFLDALVEGLCSYIE
jgi:hypothetical protein